MASCLACELPFQFLHLSLKLGNTFCIISLSLKSRKSKQVLDNTFFDLSLLTLPVRMAALHSFRARASM